MRLVLTVNMRPSYRHQSPERRPSFPDLVDELLAVEKSLPDTRYTEVCNVLYCTCYYTVLYWWGIFAQLYCVSMRSSLLHIVACIYIYTTLYS